MLVHYKGFFEGVESETPQDTITVKTLYSKKKKAFKRREMWCYTVRSVIMISTFFFVYFFFFFFFFLLFFVAQLARFVVVRHFVIKKCENSWRCKNN